MPQMMPINWIISFFMFIFIFILFNIMNFYIFNTNYKMKKKMFMNNKKNSNWKW
uniref:ATP synthase complex subunit 8 n=1 Tax=Erynnis montana TaxID=3342064 RepID=R4J9F6_ERYMO|nr:ATP synthase F0 subunit 8 [Erynnis montanus]AGJ72729.1 ATP synthase F0 subunit 8 [Erynnis montanus]